MNEIWKDIPNFVGKYQVSNKGRIKSLNRFENYYCKNTLCKRFTRGRIIKPYKCRNGYYQVTLRKHNAAIDEDVHRLVAIVFVSNPNNFPEVNHIDENKTNNCASNLEWCTQKYNVNYGTGKHRNGIKHSIKTTLISGQHQYHFRAINKAAEFINKTTAPRTKVSVLISILSSMKNKPSNRKYIHGFKPKFQDK